MGPSSVRAMQSCALVLDLVLLGTTLTDGRLAPLKGIKGCSSLVGKLLPPSSFLITPNKLTSQVLSPHTTS